MMNEQEMQFADPDWKPTGQLSAPAGNTVVNPPTPAPATSAGINSQANSAYQPASFLAYDQGYQGAWPEQQAAGQAFVPPIPAQQGGYSPASATRQRSRWWIWAVVVVFIILLSSPVSHLFTPGNGYSGSKMSSSQAMPQMQKQVYALNGARELDISDIYGNVTVQVTNDGRDDVIVVAGFDAKGNMSYQAQKMVFVSNGESDVTIYIPQNLALHLSGGVNTLEVDNFSGVLTAQTDSGAITLNNDTLAQGSSLNTNSGQIDLEGGSLNSAIITSSTGGITLNQINLSGKVAVKTGGNGSIDYSGSLDPQGNYQFTTDSGAISLALPAQTAMQVNLSQKSGSFNSDFPLNSGGAPQATVGVTTGSGDITINKQ